MKIIKKSIKKNLDKHITSLKNYNIENKKVIFLIELQDALMGIYRHGIFNNLYELNKDKYFLDILKCYIDLIDIIIFIANDRIEIIDTKKFDLIYNNGIYETDIRGSRLRDLNYWLI